MTDRSSSASLSSEASTLLSVPLWSPKSGELARTHLGRLMRQLGDDTYSAAHAWSVGNPAAFWNLTAEELGIRFAQPFERVLDLSHGPERPRWFVGGKLNIAESCLSGPANDTAIITRRSDGRTEAVSVGELASLSRRAAAGFVAAGIRQGDGVAMMTMMSVEAVAAYLGVLLLGGYVVSVPETLPADEIRTRLRIGHARLVVTQDVLVRGGKTYPLYNRVKAAGAPPRWCSPPPRGRKSRWRSATLLGRTFSLLTINLTLLPAIRIRASTCCSPRARPGTRRRFPGNTSPPSRRRGTATGTTICGRGTCCAGRPVWDG